MQIFLKAMERNTSMNPLVLLGIIGIVVLVFANWQNKKLQNLASRLPHRQLFPRAITTLVLTAQISELIKAVEHVDFVHIVAALMLLSILVATKNGTTEELQ